MVEQKDRKFGLGVLIYIFNKDFSKVLLLKRNEEKRKRNKKDWGSVGGRVDLGEKLINTCLREAKEEIGVDLNPKNIKLLKVSETPFLTDIFHTIHFVYTTVLDENEKIILNFNGEHESDEYRWFKLTDLPDKTLDNKKEIIEFARKAKEMFKGKKF